MGVPERRDREKQQRREEILRIARDLFYTGGYEKTRMSDIADHLELSKGTVYLYFRSKEDLAYAVLLQCLDLMQEMLLDPPPEKNPARGLERLYRMTRAYVGFLQENYREFYLVHMLEGALNNRLSAPVSAPEFYARLRKMKDTVTEAITQGLEDGTVRADLQPELSAVTYMIAADGFMRQMIARHHFLQHTTEYSREQLIEEVFRVLTHSLHGGTRA